MTIYTLKFRKSEQLLALLEKNFPDDYEDWKITIMFYISLNKMKALSVKRNKNIGRIHQDIAYNINRKNPKATMQIKQDICDNYQDLRDLSETARYDPIPNEDYYTQRQKENIIDARALFIKLNQYFKNNSVF